MLSLEETIISLFAKPSVVPKPVWLVHLVDTFQSMFCDIITNQLNWESEAIIIP